MSVAEKKTACECVTNLIDEVYARGYRHFITGGAIGFDTVAAVCVINARDTKYPDITLTLAVPCPDQTLKWSEKDKQNYKGGTFRISFDELRKMMSVPDSYANANVKKEILEEISI